MHQWISLAILTVINLVATTSIMARMSGDGFWGGALGTFFTPYLFFYLTTAILYYPLRLMLGRERMASFAATKMHYAGLLVGILGVLGSIGQTTIN